VNFLLVVTGVFMKGSHDMFDLAQVPFSRYGAYFSLSVNSWGVRLSLQVDELDLQPVDVCPAYTWTSSVFMIFQGMLKNPPSWHPCLETDVCARASAG
jgi:hypothetical protein